MSKTLLQYHIDNYTERFKDRTFEEVRDEMARIAAYMEVKLTMMNAGAVREMKEWCLKPVDDNGKIINEY